MSAFFEGLAQRAIREFIECHVADVDPSTRIAVCRQLPRRVLAGVVLPVERVAVFFRTENLEATGVAAVIYPRLLTSAALRGMMNAMDTFEAEVIANNGTPDREDRMISFEELNGITGLAELDAPSCCCDISRRVP